MSSSIRSKYEWQNSIKYGSPAAQYFPVQNISAMLVSVRVEIPWVYLPLVTWTPCQKVKLGVAHAPGMPGTWTFSPPLRVSDLNMHHGTCVNHVSWCMPGSLTSGFLWSRWRGKHSRHSRRMRYPQFYVSGKRPIAVPCGIIPLGRNGIM